MELEKVTAEIRPRTQWEAIDLGISLTRQHVGLLFKIWLGSIFPLCLVIFALFWNALFWGCFLVWWLKPIWERVTLYPLSRNLFGETPTVGRGLQVLPKELLRNWKFVLLGVSLSLVGVGTHLERDGSQNPGLIVLFWLIMIGLFFYRSNLYRSLILPVRYLEGLENKQYRARAQVLSFRSSGAASALTTLCLLMEIGVFFSQFVFVDFMIPEGTSWSYTQLVSDFFEGGPGVLPTWVVAIIALFYFNALAVVTWFYVGGGFGLYVNSRTWTEGWDIELTFKRLGQRLGVILMCLGFLFTAPSVRAASENVTIESILADEDFKVQVREKKTSKASEKKEREESEEVPPSSAGPSLAVFSELGTLIFWIIVTLVIAGLVWLVIANRQMFNAGPKDGSDEEVKKIRTVAGMNVTPESLPKRLMEVARELWNQGQRKEALGLLYRGAISSLVTKQLVDIEESDTELDCLRRVVASGDAKRAQYFEDLTRAWMSEAYAKEMPESELMDRIWQHWPFGEGRRS